MPNLKVICQPTSGWEEDATLELTWAVGRMSPAGFQFVIPPGAWEGGVLEGGSLETLGVVQRCVAFFGCGRQEGEGEWGSCPRDATTALLDGTRAGNGQWLWFF